MFEILRDEEKVLDDHILQHCCHPLDIQRELSSIFVSKINNEGFGYGTRSSTVFIIDNDDNIHFCERSLNEKEEWEESYYTFKIEGL